MQKEGHLVCHRCGWTFPNPHPSAKHRRSHKKVCGKLQGFKLIENENHTHLSVSDDDEYLSDENHYLVEETSTNNVKGNGKMGRQVSNKSVEEEFSDAIADFLDLETTSEIYFDDCLTTPSDRSKRSLDATGESKVEETNGLEHKSSDDEVSLSDDEGWNGKEVNGSSPVLSENSDMHLEQFSEMNVEDSENGESFKPKADLVPDCREEKNTGLDPKSIEVLGENFQNEEDKSRIMAEEVFVDDSFESDEGEDLPDSTLSVLTFSQTGKERIVSALEVQKSLYCQQDESSETHLLVAGGEGSNVPPSNVTTINVTDNFISAHAVAFEEVGANNSDITEPLFEPTVCPDEEFQEASEELKVNRTVHCPSGESELQKELICAESSITKPVKEKVKLNDLNVGLIESCAVDGEYHLLSSGEVLDNSGRSFIGEPHVKSQSLQNEKENGNVSQLSDISAIAAPDSSVDPVSQAGNVDGNRVSVSDGTVISVKDAIGALGSDNVTPKVEMTELENKIGAIEDHLSGSNNISEAPSCLTLVEPPSKEDDSASSETQKQVQDLSQVGLFPSIPQVVNESQGRKWNEEIIEKAANWDSEKSLTPLKTLLVEANGESKQKVKPIKSNKTSTRKVDVSTAQNCDDLSAKKTAHPTTAAEVITKSSEGKEWDSPARLPVKLTRGKRKSKHWVPFMCCSSSAN